MKRTKDEFFEVMHGMRTRGIRVINRTVKDEIGGSLSDLQPMVKAFREEFPEDGRAVAPVAAAALWESGPLVVPPTIQRVQDGVAAALAPLAAEVERIRVEAAASERAHARSEITAIQDGAAATIRGIQAELDDAAATTAGLVEECEELKGVIAIHLVTIDALTNARDGLDRQVVQFTADLGHAHRGKAEADAEIVALADLLVASKRETQAARDEAVKASAAADAALAEATRLRAQLDTAATEAKTSAAQIGKLDTAAAVAVERAENLTSQAAKADQERQASEALTREALTRAAGAEAEAAAAQKDVIRHQADFDRMKADHAETLTAAETKADVRVNQLRADHAAALALARPVPMPGNEPAVSDDAPDKAKGKSVTAAH